MATRKIPADMGPFVVYINEKKYVYDAGAEVDVPAEIAALIDARTAANESVKPDPVIPPEDGMVWTAESGKGKWKAPEEVTIPVADNVAAAAGEAPTAAEFKALLDALKACGLMKADAVQD